MSLGELQRVKGLIEEMYGEKGYRFATANYTVTEVAPNEKKVVFTVDEGDRVRISEIEFEGNTVFADSRLRLAMTNTKESAFISRVTKKDLYDPAKLQEDLDKVRDLYRSVGYKNVVMGDPKVEVRTVELKERVAKDQKRRMFITIPVEEGERWRFGQVSIEGNKVYPERALLRAFEHKATGWLRSKVVDDAVKDITDAYHNTGYIFARVEPELIERPDRVADLVIHITEGDQFKVGRIEFQGNERTKDKVLRRELRIYEGGLVNVTAIRNSVTKVNQLGYFKLSEETRSTSTPTPRRRRSTCSSRGRSRTAPSCSSAAAGASSTVSSASSASAPRTSSAAASRSASRCRPEACANTTTSRIRSPGSSTSRRAWASAPTPRTTTTACFRTRTATSATARAWCSPTAGTSGSSSRRASATTFRTTMTDPDRGAGAAPRPDAAAGGSAAARQHRHDAVPHPQLVAAAGLPLRQPGQPLRADPRSEDLLALEYAGGP